VLNSYIDSVTSKLSNIDNRRQLLRQSKLPFPTNPGEFWAAALKAAYGPGHVMFGFSAAPKFTNATNKKQINTGPLIGGFIFKIGTGFTKKGDTPVIAVKLKITSVKLFNLDGSIYMEYDPSREAKESTLLSLNPTLIFAKFAYFLKPANWLTLLSDFAVNPAKFFKTHSEIFYPAGLDLVFNVRGVIGKTLDAITEGGIAGLGSLVNQHAIRLTTGEISQFPPKQVGWELNSTVELVDKNDSEKRVASIMKMYSVFAHPGDERICQALVSTDLSIELIKEQVHKYLIPK